MTTFDIVVIRTGRAAVMQVRGELDLSTAPRLDEQLASMSDEGVLDVTVDLADLDFIDSSGLHALVTGLAVARTGWRPGAALPEAEHAEGVGDHGIVECLSP